MSIIATPCLFARYATMLMNTFEHVVIGTASAGRVYAVPTASHIRQRMHVDRNRKRLRPITESCRFLVTEVGQMMTLLNMVSARVSPFHQITIDAPLMKRFMSKIIAPSAPLWKATGSALCTPLSGQGRVYVDTALSSSVRLIRRAVLSIIQGFT